MKRHLIVVALLSMVALVLPGCATTPETPQQAVFAAKAGYATALTAAVAYKNLPDCAKAPAPCSDRVMVAQVRKADDVAIAALDASESAVRTPGFGESIVASAVAAAKAALAAFLSITATIRSQ